MGGSNDAQQIADQQRADEDARRVRIGQTIGQVNKIYDSPGRNQQYTDFLNAMRQQYGQQLGEQHGVAARNRKFAVSRSGLAGGSADVDSRRTLGEEHQKGLLAAENRSQSALGDLKSTDESSRLNLIQLAQSGLDAGTAASQAGAAIAANAASAKDNATVKGLGDVFGTTAETYKKQQEADAMRRGWQSPVGGPYGKTAFGS